MSETMRSWMLYTFSCAALCRTSIGTRVQVGAWPMRSAPYGSPTNTASAASRTAGCDAHQQKWPACDVVHWSIDDADQLVWVYTACGMVRIARSDVDAWMGDATMSVTAALFDVSDGARTNTYPSPVHGVSRSSDGKTYPSVHIEQVCASSSRTG